MTVRIPRGLRRVKVTANGRRLRVRHRGSHRYVALSGRRTVVVTVSGIDRSGRVTRSSRRYELCATASSSPS